MAPIPAPLQRHLDSSAWSLLEHHAPVVVRRWAGNIELATWTSEVLEGESPVPTWTDDATVFAQQLRLGRNAAFAALTVQDFLHHLPPQQLALRWSQWAEQLLDITWRWVYEHTDDKTRATLDNTTILGFGKLGGNELNLSSDIDIAFFAQPDSRGILELTGSLRQALQKFLALLSEPTADGFVFRTDLRLRPQGEQGNLIDSTDVALTYYRDMSAPWERVALLRCRPVGGNLRLGQSMLDELKSLLFRRHLDYIILEEILSVKNKIDLESRVKIRGQGNIKLEAGGIRELEFFVQALQLMHGGRIPSLQCRETDSALSALAQNKLLERDETESIRKEYWLLRAIENRIQQREDLQTHRYTTADLQQWSDTLQHLTDGESLSELLPRVQERVHERFASLRGEQSEKDHHPLTLAMLAEKLTEEEKNHVLRDADIEHPENISKYVLRFHQGLQEKTYGRLTQKQFSQLLPDLLDELWQAPAPARAIANLDRFVSRVGGRAEIYALLRQNRALIALLLKLFSTEGRLTGMLLQSPSLLDALVMSGHIDDALDPQSLHKQLLAALPPNDDLQDWLESLTRWVNEQVLQTGLHNLGGLFSHDQAGRRLTIIADLTLKAILQTGAQQIGQRFDLSPQTFASDVQVIALGRYGGQEIDFGSDLDVMFIHNARTWDATPATRVLQRLHHWMATPNRWGTLFELDSRLRPSGHSGPLLITQKGFVAYHQEHAQAWEQLPLLKARPVTGDFAQCDALILQAIHSYPPMVTQLSELDRIRTRNLAERGPEEEIKAGEGGILDLEFATSFAILANLDKIERPASRLTAQLVQLAEIGWMSPEKANRLGTFYLFLRALQGMTGLLALPGNWHDVCARWAELQKLYPVYLGNLARSIGAPEISDPGSDPKSLFLQITTEVNEFYRNTCQRIRQ